MVPFDTVGKREVERGKVEHGDLGEVGVVGKGAIDRRVDRSGRRVAGATQRASGVEIARPSFEHERTSARAAGLEIENDSDVLCPRILTHESASAEESRFLAVGE